MNNVVSKMLIVLQLVFSLLFMCFAGAVYSFQQSWRVKAETTQKSLNEKTQQVSQITADRDRDLGQKDADLKVERDKAEAAAAKLKQQEADLQRLQSELAQTQQQRDKLLADSQVLQAETEARIAESVDLRVETQKLRQTVTEELSEIRGLEDRNLGLSGAVKEAKEREIGHLDEIGRLSNLLRYYKIDPRKSIAVPESEDIAKVDGLVVATRRNQTRSAEHVEITVGSDDQVKVGMLMDVYRADKWLGQIRITDVYPDSAVGQVIENKRNGTFAKGDHVTTKL
jgi:Skp family chaperone for outer membrane proteins